MSKKKRPAKTQNDDIKRKQHANKHFIKQFVPLIAAVTLWIVSSSILHLSAIKNEAATFFINFTLQSSLLFGKVLFRL